MKKLLCILLLCASSAFADQAVNIYKPTSNGTVARGCKQVIFVMMGVYSGSIGGTTFSTAASTQTVIPVSTVGQDEVLNAIPYTIGGAGTFVIIEVR